MEVKFDDGSMKIKKHWTCEEAVNVLFAGDFCPRNRPEKHILEGRSQEIISPAKHVLHNKDLSIVNVEAVLARGGEAIKKKGPCIRLDPECADLLNAARFDVACLANNHAGDYGSDGIMETICTLQNHGLHTVGAGRNLTDAGEPLFLSVKNIDIGIYACCMNMSGMADVNKAGVNPLRPMQNAGEIRGISHSCGITIVIVHKGSEMYPFPSPRTVKTFRRFIDAGASAVVAIHAHCPQGIEIYKGCPIIYNLGNFLFDRRKRNLPDKRYDLDTFWWKGYMARIRFTPNKAAALEVIPYSFAPDACIIKPLEGDEKEGFMKYLEHISGIIDNAGELERFWHAWNIMRKKLNASEADEVDRIYMERIRKLQKGIIA